MLQNTLNHRVAAVIQQLARKDPKAVPANIQDAAFKNPEKLFSTLKHSDDAVRISIKDAVSVTCPSDVELLDYAIKKA